MLKDSLYNAGIKAKEALIWTAIKSFQWTSLIT